MARLFNGTTDFLQSSATVDLSAATKYSLAFNLYWDTFANNDNEALEHGASGVLTTGGLSINPNDSANNGGGKFGVGYRDTNLAFQYATFTRPSAATWHSYVFGFDTTLGTNTIVVYVDGVLQTLTYALNQAISGGFGNLTLNIMARNGTTLFGAGRMAELGIWPGVILTANEASSLSLGYVPSFIRPSSLGWYWPLRGTANTNSVNEIELIKGNGLGTGTSTVTNHPTVLIPSLIVDFPNVSIYNDSVTFTITAAYSTSCNLVISSSLSLSNSSTCNIACVGTFAPSFTCSATSTFTTDCVNVLNSSVTLSASSTCSIACVGTFVPSFTCSTTNTYSIDCANVVNTSTTFSTTVGFAVSPNNVVSVAVSYIGSGVITYVVSNTITAAITLTNTLLFCPCLVEVSFADRVKESSTSTGVSDFVLSGVESGGFRSFVNTIGVGNRTCYTIQNPTANEFEVGLGILINSTTLRRQRVLANSNNDLNFINFSAGSKDVFCDVAALFIYPNLAVGDLFFVGIDGLPRRLPIGEEGQQLKSIGGLPQWV